MYTGPSGNVLQSFTYQLDANGNRLSKAFADGTAEKYAYDANNRLTEFDDAVGNKTSYTLNGFDQISSLSKTLAAGGSQLTTNTYNAFNQLTKQVVGSATTNYSFDGNGSLTLAAPTNGSSTVYRYDQDNRMTEADLPGGVVDTFEYDANGLRTTKNDSTGTTHYLLDGPSVIAEYNGTNSVTEQHNNNPQRIDEQFCLIQHGIKYWPITDALGSVHALTDRAGNQVANYSYDVYGARTRTNGAVSTAWGYTGREHDPDMGLNYNRDRYLKVVTTMWTQADRLGMGGDGPNYYMYAGVAPVSTIDPGGSWGVTPGSNAIRQLGILDAMRASSDATDAAIEFETEHDQAIKLFARVVTNGTIRIVSFDFDLSLVHFVPNVVFQIDCSPSAPHDYGYTPRHQGFLPSIYVVKKMLDEGHLGPQIVAATVLHEWVHASVDRFEDDHPGAEDIMSTTYVSNQFVQIPDTEEEAIASAIEQTMFGNQVLYWLSH